MLLAGYSTVYDHLHHESLAISTGSGLEAITASAFCFKGMAACSHSTLLKYK